MDASHPSTGLLAGAGALAVGNLFTGPQSVAIGALAGMLVRMAVPLVFVMIVYSQGGALVESGMVFYLLAYYLITLAAETWMSVRRVSPQPLVGPAAQIGSGPAAHAGNLGPH